MKKEKLLILVLLLSFLSGFLTHRYPYIAGFFGGNAFLLLLFGFIGQWQFKKAAARIDKVMEDERRLRDFVASDITLEKDRT